ncbi:hypothetical protein M0R45_027836 [Rubus argutus]|uniref:Protein TIC 20 n=1 Tax=Rubus argutus TaxID=59490 RepID=A0AAW1W5Z8_RUBAR
MASIHVLHGLSPTSPKTLIIPKYCYPPCPFPSTHAARSLCFPHQKQMLNLNLNLSLRPKSRSKSTITCSGSPTPATDRLISAVSYTLPFFNSLQYGRYLFFQFPKLGLLFEPLLPLLGLYRSIPYSSFVAFFALYLGVVRNPSFSHYTRFNAMQAVTLDVLLVLPLLIQRIFSPGQAGLGYKLMVWGHNGIFVFSVLCFVYGLVSSILGRTPYLPFVADAAGRQL